jgi:predicted metal-dependent peptidase
MLRHPYLASAVARLPVVNASGMDWCQTMATDGYYIYVNSEFCEGLDESELTGVIAHEVLHCVLGHSDRRGSRDRQLWNVAIDFAVNLLLVDAGFNLPSEGLLDRRYRGMTAEDIYNMLIQDQAGGSSEMIGAGFGLPGENAEDAKSAPGGFDVHLEAGDIEGAATRADDYPSPQERIRIRAGLCRELASKLPGREAGFFAEELKRASTPRVSWQQLLQRFFTGLRRDDYRTFPFNRKHLWRQIYMPSIGKPGPDHIAIAVDTSGSMSNEILSKALAEIDGLRAAAGCNLTLIQCDAKIQSINEYDPWELTERTFADYQFLGRGGTSLKPPFVWIQENLLMRGKPIDALIYFTDGYGDAPDTAPSFPTLWLVPDTGFREAPFGHLIRMN